MDQKKKNKSNFFFFVLKSVRFFYLPWARRHNHRHCAKRAKTKSHLQKVGEHKLQNKTTNDIYSNVHNTLRPCNNIKMTFLLQLISDLMASTCISSGSGDGGGGGSKSAHVCRVFVLWNSSTCYMRCCDRRCSC